MLVCREHRHVAANLREDLNRRKRVFVETGNSAYQFESVKVRIRNAKDFPFHFCLVLFQLIDVVQTLTKLYSLFWRDSAVNSGLDFFNWGLASSIHKRSDIKGFTGMGSDNSVHGSSHLSACW